MSQKLTLPKWIAFGAALFVFFYLGFRVLSPKHSDLYGKISIQSPEFSFKDQEGQIFSSAQLKGKVWVADFIFTRCAGSCPMLSDWLRRLQVKYAGDDHFKLVSLTVDPAHDTVPVLHQYAKALKAPADQWVFLTGDKKKLYQTIREGFKAAAQENPEGGAGFDFIHSTRIMLVDQKGVIRGFYDGDKEEEVKKLEQDLEMLLGKGKQP